jgi:hypothetical protein
VETTQAPGVPALPIAVEPEVKALPIAGERAALQPEGEWLARRLEEPAVQVSILLASSGLIAVDLARAAARTLLG